jgi:hypothetical protein
MDKIGKVFLVFLLIECLLSLFGLIVLHFWEFNLLFAKLSIGNYKFSSMLQYSYYFFIIFSLLLLNLYSKFSLKIKFFISIFLVIIFFKPNILSILITMPFFLINQIYIFSNINLRSKFINMLILSCITIFIWNIIIRKFSDFYD